MSFLPFEWMNKVVTLLWLVGITNAFNLLDNMDGLSAGVAFVASVVLLINAWSLGEFFISLLLVAFMGCLLGFLVFNFEPRLGLPGRLRQPVHRLRAGLAHPARALRLARLEHALPGADAGDGLAVPLVDTATVMVIRLWERRPIYVGDAGTSRTAWSRWASTSARRCSSST